MSGSRTAEHLRDRVERERRGEMAVSTEQFDIPEVFAAIRRGRIKFIRAQLAVGLSPETTSKDGWTLLHEAAAYGRVAATRLLLEHRANCNALDRSRRSPLFVATQAGSYSTVQVLLAAGADVALSSVWGTTSLHKAAMVGQAEIAELLVRAGADVHVVAKGFGGTPLHMAVRDPHDCDADSDRAGVGKLLIARGAHVDARDEHGQTPLHKASREGDQLMADLLLHAGADPNATEEDGRTPLHLASIQGSVAVTRALLQRGAKVDVRDRFGEAPLHRAAGAARPTMIRLLLAAGADPTAKSDAGLLPAHMLRRRLDGSDPEARAKYGWRAERELPKSTIRATLRALEGLRQRGTDDSEVDAEDAAQ